jgi:hypothetical protein
MTTIRIFWNPLDPQESCSSKATAKDGAPVVLTELEVGSGTGPASCDGGADSDSAIFDSTIFDLTIFFSTILFSFAGGAVTFLAGAGAAADPGAAVKAELVFCAGKDVAAMFAASFLTSSFLATSF